MSARGESTSRRPTGATRTAVLDAVRRSEQPITVHEIAAELGLHANSVRFHLSRLLRDGELREEPTDPDGPGRPHMVYRAVTGDRIAPPPSTQSLPPAAAAAFAAEVSGTAAPGARLTAAAASGTAAAVPAAAPAAPGTPAPAPPAAVAATNSGYQFLAEMLAGHLAATSPTPGATAGAVGDAWGHYLAERPVPFSRTTEEASIERVSEILDRVGFSPVRHPEDSHRLLLQTCPFRTVADHRPTVVCAVHLGLMRGALAEMDAPVEVERLDRFDAPYPCIARLRARTLGSGSGDGAAPAPASTGGDGTTPATTPAAAPGVDPEAPDPVQNLPGWAGRVAI